MAYVEGAFADRKFKRRAVMVLAAVSVVSFADGLVRRAGWLPSAAPTDTAIVLQQAALAPTSPARAPLQMAAMEPAPTPAPIARKAIPAAAEAPPAAVVEGVDVVASAPATEEVRPSPETDEVAAAAPAEALAVEPPAETAPPME